MTDEVGPSGTNQLSRWDEVVNPPSIQVWMAPWTLLWGAVAVKATRDLLTLPPSDPSWSTGAFMLALGCLLYPVLYVVFWRRMAVFLFAADRIGLRTWVQSLLRRPPRVIPITPALSIAFVPKSLIVVRDGTAAYPTEAILFPPSQMHRLIAAAEARSIPITYGWKPDFMLGRDTRPWWQRLLADGDPTHRRRNRLILVGSLAGWALLLVVIMVVIGAGR